MRHMSRSFKNNGHGNLHLVPAFRRNRRSKPPASLLVPIIIFATLFVWHTAAFGETQLKKVSLMPQWIPQAQFAGYMVALDKGFYREAGLDVRLLQGGPGKDGFCAVADGKATFCTGWLSSAITRRASGKRLVNIAQIAQRSALMLVALKKSGISGPQDLNGKKIGYWVGEFEAPIQCFIKKHGLRVKMIPNYTTVTILLKGAVDAVAAMRFNEYHTLLNSGYNKDELKVLSMEKLGANFPEDGLYCMEDTFNSDPRMCSALTVATLKGWLYAFEHEKEAVDIVMKYAEAANTGTNMAHQRWMLRQMKRLILPSDGGLEEMGLLKRAAYTRVGKSLVELGVIKRLPAFEDFYRGR